MQQKHPRTSRPALQTCASTNFFYTPQIRPTEHSERADRDVPAGQSARAQRFELIASPPSWERLKLYPHGVPFVRVSGGDRRRGSPQHLPGQCPARTRGILKKIGGGSTGQPRATAVIQKQQRIDRRRQEAVEARPLARRKCHRALAGSCPSPERRECRSAARCRVEVI